MSGSRVLHGPCRAGGRDAPAYPRRAKDEGIAGWIDVQFTVGRDGIPQQVRIVAAEPKGVFEKSVATAVAGWRYAPLPAAQAVSLRLRFALEP